jgi:hypothetical protein
VTITKLLKDKVGILDSEKLIVATARNPAEVERVISELLQAI